MKKIMIFFAAVMLMSSCDNDFKVGADYKEVTVVYGLLDHGAINNHHYIKILRGFYSETLDNLQVAQDVDSIYFPNLEVKMEELNNGNIVNTFFLNEVDLNLEPDIQKEMGTFVNSPNIGYKFTAQLNPDSRYKLTVTNKNTGKVVTGETGIITTNDNVFFITRPFTASDKLNFANPNGNYNYRWNNPPAATFFDVMLRFKYQEINLNNNDTTRKIADLRLTQFVLPNGSTTDAKVSNETFYSLLGSGLGAATQNIVRRVDSADLYILAGSADLKRYIDVNNAQGGLTADQIKPNFTNLEGENVLGIFSARSTKVLRNLDYTDATMDSLISGSRTRNLNIVGRAVK